MSVWLSLAILGNFMCVGVYTWQLTSLKQILVISSLRNNRWLCLRLTSTKIFLGYLRLYSLHLALVFYSWDNTISTVNIIALTGLPPFPLFLFKLALLNATWIESGIIAWLILLTILPSFLGIIYLFTRRKLLKFRNKFIIFII